ncbi:MAG: hypothetical protein FJZ16_07400, partial [Candidatus Omnitrophica bacterium]|nr:hypothetical protein [Candidatus Omnitrophota bacterium]
MDESVTLEGEDTETVKACLEILRDTLNNIVLNELFAIRLTLTDILDKGRIDNELLSTIKRAITQMDEDLALLINLSSLPIKVFSGAEIKLIDLDVLRAKVSSTGLAELLDDLLVKIKPALERIKEASGTKDVAAIKQEADLLLGHINEAQGDYLKIMGIERVLDLRDFSEVIADLVGNPLSNIKNFAQLRITGQLKPQQVSELIGSLEDQLVRLEGVAKYLRRIAEDSQTDSISKAQYQLALACMEQKRYFDMHRELERAYRLAMYELGEGDLAPPKDVEISTLQYLILLNLILYPQNYLKILPQLLNELLMSHPQFPDVDKLEGITLDITDTGLLMRIADLLGEKLLDIPAKLAKKEAPPEGLKKVVSPEEGIPLLIKKIGELVAASHKPIVIFIDGSRQIGKSTLANSMGSSLFNRDVIYAEDKLLVPSTLRENCIYLIPMASIIRSDAKENFEIFGCSAITVMLIDFPSVWTAPEHFIADITIHWKDKETGNYLADLAWLKDQFAATNAPPTPVTARATTPPAKPPAPPAPTPTSSLSPEAVAREISRFIISGGDRQNLKSKIESLPFNSYETWNELFASIYSKPLSPPEAVEWYYLVSNIIFKYFNRSEIDISILQELLKIFSAEDSISNALRIKIFESLPLEERPYHILKYFDVLLHRYHRSTPKKFPEELLDRFYTHLRAIDPKLEEHFRNLVELGEAVAKVEESSIFFEYERKIILELAQINEIIKKYGLWLAIFFIKGFEFKGGKLEEIVVVRKRDVTVYTLYAVRAGNKDVNSNFIRDWDYHVAGIGAEGWMGVNSPKDTVVFTDTEDMLSSEVLDALKKPERHPILAHLLSKTEEEIGNICIQNDRLNIAIHEVTHELERKEFGFDETNSDQWDLESRAFTCVVAYSDDPKLALFNNYQRLAGKINIGGRLPLEGPHDFGIAYFWGAVVSYLITQCSDELQKAFPDTYEALNRLPDDLQDPGFLDKDFYAQIQGGKRDLELNKQMLIVGVSLCSYWAYYNQHMKNIMVLLSRLSSAEISKMARWILEFSLRCRGITLVENHLLYDNLIFERVSSTYDHVATPTPARPVRDIIAELTGVLLVPHQRLVTLIDAIALIKLTQDVCGAYEEIKRVTRGRETDIKFPSAREVWSVLYETSRVMPLNLIAGVFGNLVPIVLNPAAYRVSIERIGGLFITYFKFFQSVSQNPQSYQRL